MLSILCICFYASWRHADRRAGQVQEEYADSLSTYKNKAGEAYAAMDVLITSKKDLEKQNAELAEEVKSLKDNPIVVTETLIKYVVRDTIETEVDSVKVISPDLQKYSWSARDTNGWYAVSGASTVDYSSREFANSVTGVEMSTKLAVDLIEQDKKLTVIAKSDNPYVSIAEIDGAVIDPTKSDVLKSQFRQKKWGVGPYLGFGVTGNMEPAWTLGVSVHYSVFSW